MEKELVSIIIPTYNRSYLIGETIASIQNQSYIHWECIIVDDESTDDTESVVLKYIENDARISFYKKPKHLQKGPSSARNYGFTKSKGQYINWFDSDDLMQPQKLEIDLKHLISGNFDFTISQTAFFKEQTTPKKKFWNKTIWSNNPINDFITKKIGWSTNSPLWLRKSLEVNNLIFDEQLMTADDFKFHVQALQFGLKPVIINQVLVSQREHVSRLNNYPEKAPNKIRTYLYLMKYQKALKLDAYTLAYLNWHFMKYYSSLLKAKKISYSTVIFFRVIFLNFKLETKTKLLKLWFFGFFYYVTGSGYKLLKY